MPCRVSTARSAGPYASAGGRRCRVRGEQQQASRPWRGDARAKGSCMQMQPVPSFGAGKAEGRDVATRASTRRRETDYGFLWVVLALALAAISLVGAAVWLVRTTRHVAPRYIRLIWALIAITCAMLGFWVLGEGATGDGFFPTLGRAVASQWRAWLPDLVTLYVVACTLLKVQEKNLLEEPQRRLKTEVLRISAWAWVVVLVAVLAAAWSALFGWGLRPGVVGMALTPALVPDPNFLPFGLHRAEAIVVLILTGGAALAAARIRTRTRAVWLLLVVLSTVGASLSVLDAVLVQPAEVLGVVVNGAVARELFRLRGWFYRT